MCDNPQYYFCPLIYQNFNFSAQNLYFQSGCIILENIQQQQIVWAHCKFVVHMKGLVVFQLCKFGHPVLSFDQSGARNVLIHFHKKF